MVLGLDSARRTRTSTSRARYEGTISRLSCSAVRGIRSTAWTLEPSADDYLAEPLALRELVARVRAVQRRTAAPGPSPGTGQQYQFEGWIFDLDDQRSLSAKAPSLPRGRHGIASAFAASSCRLAPTVDQHRNVGVGNESHRFAANEHAGHTAFTMGCHGPLWRVRVLPPRAYDLIAIDDQRLPVGMVARWTVDQHQRRRWATCYQRCWDLKQ
jgi:hypothetical protein